MTLARELAAELHAQLFDQIDGAPVPDQLALELFDALAAFLGADETDGRDA